MTPKKLFISFIVVLIVVGTVWFLTGRPQPYKGNMPGSSDTGTTQPSQSGAAAPASGKGSQKTTGTITKPAITFTSPGTSEIWALNTLHVISWKEPTGVPGGIYLVDAKTNLIVGWINVSTDPHQTSYSWDTRQVLISRTSSLKKEISAGLYFIKITFDGSHRADSQSQPITITYPDQIPTVNHNITIKNFAFIPNSLTVKHGEKVTFTNNDSIVHNVAFQNMTPHTLNPGESYILDTSILGAGSYPYYCTIHPSMTGTLIVQ